MKVEPPPLPSALSFGVVIASYGRPEYLARCLQSVSALTRRPDEVIVVGRSGDEKTREAAALTAAETTLPLRYETVDRPGHLPPLARGVEVAVADVLGFLDDDCEAAGGWAAALLQHYADGSVGGVGGLVLQPALGEARITRKIGNIDWRGRLASTRSAWLPATDEVRDVDVLIGCNMSYRRTVIQAYEWDARMNVGAATDFEVHLAAYVRAQGHRVVWDPAVAVIHHVAPRPHGGRGRTPEEIRAYSHNLVYVAGRSLSPLQGTLSIVDAFLIGNRFSYGVGTAVADSLLGRPPSLGAQLIPAFGGKVAGIRSLVASARSGPERLD